MKKTYKEIENSRNNRLWITEVVMPITLVGMYIFGNPENRRDLKNFCNKVKDKIIPKKEDNIITFKKE